MSKAVDDILGFLRGEQLSMEDQAELITRLKDGEADNHKPAGQWVARGRTEAFINAEDNGFKVDWVHGPNFNPDQGLGITFYHGQMDGKPVIQIDGSADFRINVNDAPVWDQSTEVDYAIPDELREELDRRQGVKCRHCGRPHHSSYCEDVGLAVPAKQKVWVGIISDRDGIWPYVGASEEALYREMRSNYGEIEYREESNRDWARRVDDRAFTLKIDSYYVEEE